MSKVVLSGHILVPEEEIEIVKRALVRHIQLTRLESGCLVFRVVQDEAQHNKFHVYEEFVDANAFATHQRRVRQSEWGFISKNVERCYHIVGIAAS